MADCDGKVVVPAALTAAAADADGDADMADSGGRRSRAAVACRLAHARFILPKQRIYTHQYSHVYLKRLHALRRVVERQAAENWPDLRVIEKVIELSASTPTCVVVGTLYKQQRLKPSVMDEFTEEFSGAAAKEELDNYCADDDTLILEDESGRMELAGLEQDLVDSLITGIIVGVKGKLCESGEFVVEEYIFPGFPEQKPFQPLADADPALEDVGPPPSQYLLLASGLMVGDSTDPLRLQLLIDYVLGQLGGPTDQALESAIVRVIIAGGSVASPGESDAAGAQAADATSAANKRTPGFKHENKFAGPVKQLDVSLAELSTSVPVDVMPGGTDPCNLTMPQQPLHRCLFPHSERFQQTFHRVTNPFECVLDDSLTVTGTSGQPITDMLKYTRHMSAVDLLEATLRWRHIAPTAPDTLPCYPVTMIDPFVLTHTPHVYFAGDQAEFDTRLVREEKGTVSRLVAIPRFSETGTVVLVDLASKDLDCSTIRFDGLASGVNDASSKLAPAS